MAAPGEEKPRPGARYSQSSALASGAERTGVQARAQLAFPPDRRQVTQATAVVLGFVAIAGAYLGLADYIAKEIVEFVL